MSAVDNKKVRTQVSCSASSGCKAAAKWTKKKTKTTPAAERSEGAADFTVAATGIANRRVVGSQEFSKSCVQAVERSRRRLAGCSRTGGGGGLGGKGWWLLCFALLCLLVGAAASRAYLPA